MIKNQIIYVDMDDVLCDFMESYKEQIQKCPEIKFPPSQVDFFSNLKPINGALEAFKRIFNLLNTEMYILSASSEKNPLSYMEKRI